MDWKAELITSLLVGVASSAMASLIFLFALFRLKPHIIISPFIADETDREGHPCYVFKIVNRTSYPIHDVQCELLIASPENVEGGVVWSNKKISLVKDRMFQLGKYSKRDKDALYAWRFSTHENVNSLWNDGHQQVRLKVMARHSLSGFSSAEAYTFHVKRGAIIKGSHCFGAKLGVV